MTIMRQSCDEQHQKLGDEKNSSQHKRCWFSDKNTQHHLLLFYYLT